MRPKIYPDHRDNHAIWPGRRDALEEFVNKTYGGRRHKLANARSSHSEDALTWSCFDCLEQLDGSVRDSALAEMWELAFRDRKGAASMPLPEGVRVGQIRIGETYGGKIEGTNVVEKTEVDASIESATALVFIEAKLYSPMSQADGERKPHDQIALKLRVGAREAIRSRREFFFILLDLAPPDMLRTLNPRASLNKAKQRGSGFKAKWLTAYWFSRYSHTRGGSSSPLREALEKTPSVAGADPKRIARNMGWLTWADVFKVTLRATFRELELR